MIKKLTNPTDTELDTILDIWLTVNQASHRFIEANYWQDNLDYVRQALPAAELFVAYENEQIIGFLGLTADYISGIFIRSDFRNKGIGTELLNTVKAFSSSLKLSVYEQNSQAVNFYLKNGFILTANDVDFKTDQAEYLMTWKQPNI